MISKSIKIKCVDEGQNVEEIGNFVYIQMHDITDCKIHQISRYQISNYTVL